MPEWFGQAKGIYHQAREAETVRIPTALSFLLLAAGVSLIVPYLCGAMRDGVSLERLSCPVVI